MAKKGKDENRLEKDWKKELARDCAALGGIFFYALVVARVAMLQNWNYVFQFVFAAVVFFLLAAVFRFKAEAHAGLGFVLLVLISLYYKNMFFASFAILVYIALILSLFYLKAEKMRVWKGILAGAASTAIGYFIASLLF
ncbi:hypothetical protein HYT26_02045 [Candidatus Pacearchaeota archaeon]|nr:hypothetical protein [Candidatus Pacearchaeota archaeon]